MPIIVFCSSCQHPLRVPDDLLGQLVKCPTCGHTFTASAADAAAAPVQQYSAGSPGEKGASYEAPAPQPDVPLAGPTADYGQGPPQRTPGKVQAIAIMTLVGGILALLTALTWLGVGGLASFGICCLWPGGYYSLILGILATIKGSKLLGKDGFREAPPKAIAIMQIINIVNGDIANCVMGTLTLVFLNEPEVRNYYRG